MSREGLMALVAEHPAEQEDGSQQLALMA